MYIRYTVCVCIFICLQGFCYAVFLEIQFKQTRCTEWSDVELSIWVSESELSRAAGTDWVCFAYAIIVLCLSAVCMGKAGVSVFRCVCILDILCVCVCVRTSRRGCVCQCNLETTSRHRLEQSDMSQRRKDDIPSTPLTMTSHRTNAARRAEFSSYRAQ